MTLTSIFSAIFSLILSPANASMATAPEVRFIGQNYASTSGVPAAVLPAERCLPQGKALGAVKVRVIYEAAEVDHVKLDYGNGVFDEFRDLRETLKKGQSTDWLALKTSMQCVSRVEVSVLEARGAERTQGVPVVQVWGLVDDRTK